MDAILSWILGILASIGIVVWVVIALLPIGSKTVVGGGSYLIKKYMKSKKRI